MKKKLLFAIFFFIPLVMAIEECPRFAYPKDIPCIVESTWKPDTGCIGNITYYNASNTSVYNGSWYESKPFCKAVFNYSGIGTFVGNSTIEDSVITIAGDDEQMIFTIALFLIIINLIVFALPFWVTFSISEAANYVVKRMLWIAALLLLWFNTTLFRQLASDWGLNIDSFLLAYWWIFTLGVFASILIMCYVAVVGAVKLMKEAQLKKRMGEDGYSRQEVY